MKRYSKYLTSALLGVLAVAGLYCGIGGEEGVATAANITTINMTLTENITISALDITISDLAETIDEAAQSLISVLDDINDTADRLFEAFVLFAFIALAIWKEKTWPVLLVFAGLAGIFIGILWLKDYTVVSIIVMSLGFCLIVIPVWRKFGPKRKAGAKNTPDEEV